MGSSRTITLFHDSSEYRRPDSLLISTVVHGGLIGLLSFGIMDTAAIKDPMLTERYVTRQLELHRVEPRMRRSSGVGADYPARRSAPHPTPPVTQTSPQPIQLPALKTGLQTVVQPDIHSSLTPTQMLPIPKVVIWRPATTPAKKIVPPPSPERAAADVAPSLELPNVEEHVANLALSSSSWSVHPQAILPSTTSPLKVPEPGVTRTVPLTGSKPTSDPAPAAALTLSDTHMPDGTAVLPPLNQTAPAVLTGVPNQRPENGKTGNADNSSQQTGASIGSGGESYSGSSAAEGLSVQRITLPKDGRFGVVVVGSSLEDKYPETAELWTGRLAYTVYLHVGLSRSWILQYSLPRSEDARSAGTIARIEAPWPYVIVRPDIPSGAVNADALMVHGFVNEAGRFEELSIVSPPQPPLGPFILNALQQWQFRPAMHSRQSTRVEVLLLIPEVPE